MKNDSRIPDKNCLIFDSENTHWGCNYYDANDDVGKSNIYVKTTNIISFSYI